jgi:hypothetical protein
MLLRIQTVEEITAVDALRKGIKGIPLSQPFIIQFGF